MITLQEFRKKVKNKYILGIIEKIVFLINIIFFASEISPFVYHCRDYTSNKYVRLMLKFILTPYYVIKYFFARDVPERKGLAFVLIAKNEAPYINEWLDFHIKQGVSSFIIYDNESTDNFHDVLQPYIEAGIVKYQIIKGRCRQSDAYNMALAEYSHKFKYMGFIDCDEFVFVRELPNGGGDYDLYDFIDRFMSEHKIAGGIGINWCIFGSNGHETMPSGGVLENYTMRSHKDFYLNLLIKTICDPMKTLSYKTHYPIYRRGFHNLDENGKIIPFETYMSSKVSFEKIRINHYFDKSKEEFLKKRKRGKADMLSITRMSAFDEYDQNYILDTEILSRI